MQEVLTRPVGSGHPSDSVRDVHGAIFFFFFPPHWHILAFQSLGCLEKLMASVTRLSWSPVTTLFLQRACFLLFLQSARNKLLALCSEETPATMQPVFSGMNSGGMMSAALPLARLWSPLLLALELTS